MTTLESLLNAKTESEFFVTMCAFLDHYERDGVPCKTKLVIHDKPRPSLEVALYMVLWERRPRGNKVAMNEKVWAFTLFNNNELLWEKADFEALEPGLYAPPQRTMIVGLEAIKQTIQQGKHFWQQANCAAHKGDYCMFYWLFTQGRALLAAFIFPLTCLSILMPIITAALLGIGIQRRADGTPLQTKGWMTVARLLTVIIPNVGVVALYTNLLGGMAIARATTRNAPLSGFTEIVVGGTNAINQPRLMILGFALASLLFFLNIGLWQGIRNGGWLRESIDRLRRPNNRRGEMGSAHFCTRREYMRYRREDSDGLAFLGAFWGEKHLRLDVGWGKFCLSGEDIARGILVLGAPGSGKSAGVILPAIADRMNAGHSLVVADPQGELTDHILKYAKSTRHLVVIHDPTSLTGPRYNLAEGLDNIPAASAIARVLIPSAQGDNRFWTDSATDLLTACLIRFDNLGQIKSSLDDLQSLAKKLSAIKDDAALAASAFIASVGADGKVASNVVATLGTALTGWASAQVRNNTSRSDFDAQLIVSQPTVTILTCPGEMRQVYAPYLGAVLRKIMRDLDSIGQRNKDPKRKGQLPLPVGIILDEFPILGKLDAMVEDVNLVRKRRISVLIAAQAKGQFHNIYGEDGTKALFTGLATQIVYGGGDHDTAEFYSKASGTATVDANPDPHKGNLRQRPLLTTDEIINPEDGVCHIFSRYAQSNYATQVILKAQLTRIYERTDWDERLASPVYDTPLQLERGSFSDDVLPAPPTPVPTKPATPPIAAPAQKQSNLSGEIFNTPSGEFEKAAALRMTTVRETASPAEFMAAHGVQTSSAQDMKKRFGKKSTAQA